ncbi:MAG: SusC/RagA family TonB-linked outer membrane protein [Gemmatimonadaceae bacterium]|nr:SusC/RagA family TonB-linked outer membrane protein [Gemmatimonadaceae bacterium]
MSNSHRLLVGVAAFVGFAPLALSAQEATNVTGTVTSSQAPVENVAVSIPELRIGGYTDQAGKYRIVAPATASGRTVVLIARRVGYTPDSARITLSGGTLVQDLDLRTQATQLTGVVVTALGVVREKSTLGTAQQQISTEDLNVTKTQNLVEQVQGKVSGVQINGAGTPGGSTNFVIRGYNTFASNNQPLFVVDGIPVSNANRGGGLGNGYDFGNAISDINPEDVESMTILKGPNAAAIYGSRAQNGAVVITTKKGSASAGRVRTDASLLYTWEYPGRLPDYQNQYGQGAGGQFKYVDGAGGGICDGCDQSWGPKLDGRMIHQFTDGADTSVKSPWIAHPNNVKDFFNTGHTLSLNSAVSGGGERANARMSIGVDNVEGYVPNNSFQKPSALLTGTLNVNSKLQTTATLGYTRNNGKNRPGTGYGNSILEGFYWFGRQVDVNALRNWQQGGATNNGPDNREFNWNYNFHNNPFFVQEASALTDSRDRFIIQGAANYKFTDWLSANLMSGSDIYRFSINQDFPAAFLNGSYVNQSYNGGFQFINDYNNENNTELKLIADRNVTSDIHVNALVGGNLRRENFNTTSTTTRGLTVAGIYNVSNAAISPTLGQTLNRRAMNSVLGSASVTYRGFWTVEGTGRNDVSSTLPKGNNSYFYPSVATSIVLTEAIPALKNNWMSFLKVRGGVAQVGNDTDPYRLLTTFAGNSNKFGGRPQFSLSDQLMEPNLKPEITRSNEAGIEMGFFDQRLSVDLTAYDKRTRNQIYLVPVSPASGYSQKLLNAGEMQNKGFEALLTATPIRMANFDWTANINFSQNRNQVLSLAGGVDRIVLGNGLFGDVRTEATVGKPYGAIWGGGYVRDDQGRILTSGGIPIVSDTFVYHGSIQPKWTGGITNQFRYKAFTFGGSLDIRHGGKIMSYSNYVGEYSGVLKSTLRGREVDWDNPGIVVNGIDEKTGQPNTTRVTAEEYFQGLFFNVEPYVYDASYTKLRELRVGFDVPADWAQRFRVSGLSVALTGRNLYTWTDVPNIDPEFTYSSGNFQGMEYAIPGNTRSFGINLRITP